MSAMRPGEKAAKACKAMQAYGIPARKVKPALRELLQVYDGHWDLIEDDGYKVLLDFILAEKQEDDKVLKSEKKSPLHAKPQEDEPLVTCNPQEDEPLVKCNPQEDEPLVKRLRSRKQKEKVSASTDRFNPTEKNVVEVLPQPQTTSDSEDSPPLLKRPCRRKQTDASPSVDNSIPIVVETSAKVEEYEDELSRGSQSRSMSEYLGSPLISLLPQHQEKEASVSMNDLLPQHQEKEASVSTNDLLPQHQEKEASVSMNDSKLSDSGNMGWDVVEISQPCLNEGVAESIQLYPSNVETNPKPLSDEDHVEDKGKEVDAPRTLNHLCYDRKRRLKSSSCQEKGKAPLVPPNINVHPSPFVDDKLVVELPLAVIHPASPSQLCGDDSSHKNPSHNKENRSKYLESMSLNSKEKDDDLSDFSQFDIASSADGEVKISLSCNSSQQYGFHIPHIDSVLKLADKKCRELYKVMEPSFSVKRLLKDVTECFVAVGSDHVVSDECVQFETVSPVVHHISGEVAQTSNLCMKEAVKNHSLACRTVDPFAFIEDITRGEERVKISLVNRNSSEDFPIFLYISQNIVYHKACVNITMASISDEDCCSQCSKDCLLSPMPCQCAKPTGTEFAYTPEGLLKDSFLEGFISSSKGLKRHSLFFCRDCLLERSKGRNEPKSCRGHLERRFIKECWSKCGCSKNCGNRVVQRGISAALQVFQTPEGKGWGVRTLDELPRGAFVCEYVGEIITNSEMHERRKRGTYGKKHTYPVPLDADWFTEGILKDEEALYLDNSFYGNVARFINHSCSEANLIGIPVEVESPDHHYYHLAFFTTRNVAAMEELTWDYGLKFDGQDHLVGAFKCLCGSSSCRRKDQ